jgi:hypothetical protein
MNSGVVDPEQDTGATLSFAYKERRPSEQRRKGCELAFEVRPVPGKACDESEVLEVEAGSYVATHQ